MKRFNRVLLMTLVMVFFTGIIPITTFSASETEDVFEIQDGALVKYNGSDSKVFIPEGVTSIKWYAFSETCVEEVIIPNSVTTIESSAFWSSRNLRKLRIPRSVSVIEDRAFSLCDKLEELEIDNENKNYTVVDGILYTKDMTKLISCPSGKGGVVDIPESITTITGGAFWYCWYVDEINLNNKLASIGGGAFNGCHGLKSIYIPASVKNIEARVFTDCINLENILVDKNNSNYIDIDGVLFTRDKSKLVGFPYNKMSTYTVPNGTTEIENCVFMFNSKLTLVTIPDSVTNIGCNTFWDCNNVTIQCTSGSYAEDYAKKHNIPIKYIEPEALTIIEYSPKNQQTDVDHNVTIEFSFSAIIDGDTSNIKLRQFDNDMLVPAVVGLNSNKLIIKPILPLGLGKRYYVDIPADVIKEKYNLTGVSAFRGLKKNGYSFVVMPEILKPEKFNTNIKVPLNTGICNKNETSFPVTWDDTYFNAPSDYYNHDLAKLSVLLSSAAYGTEDKPHLDRYIRDALINLRFSDNKIELVTRNYKDGEDTVGIAFGHKKIVANSEEFDLIAVVIRGTPGNEEWYGNFDVGMGTVHAGFEKAKIDLENHLKEYISTLELGKNRKVLITGHSRGAAVANLLAKDLTDGYLSLAKKDDIYTYTFAAPKVSTDVDHTYPKTLWYNNIYNLSHYDDFVPVLPLVHWDYSRYGNSFPFPNTQYSKMANEFKKITGVKFRQFNNPRAVKEFEKDLYTLAPSVFDFYRTKKNLGNPLSTHFVTPHFYFRNYICEALIEEGFTAGTLAVLNGSMQPYNPFMPVSQFFLWYGGNPLNRQLQYSHTYETYISWIYSLDKDWINKRYPATVSSIKIACPVDVFVYDEEGVLVGRVVENKVDDTIDNPVNITLSGTNNEIKTIVVPPGSEYEVEIVATGKGTMAYSVADINMEDDQQLSYVLYSDIDINEGDIYTGKIEDWEKRTVPYYQLTDSRGKALIPMDVVLNIQNSLDCFNRSRKYSDDIFVDIGNTWYTDYVKNAYEYGIIDGVGNNRYAPSGIVSGSQAITVATRIHMIYKYGRTGADAKLDEYSKLYPAGQNGNNWATMYIKYAKDEGLIGNEFDNKLDMPITRAEIFHAWAKILQPKDMAKTCQFIDVPDVTKATAYYDDIVLFYESGIISGTDSHGTCKPDNCLSRAEFATIFMRLIEIDARNKQKVYSVNDSNYSIDKASF